MKIKNLFIFLMFSKINCFTVINRHNNDIAMFYEIKKINLPLKFCYSDQNENECRYEIIKPNERRRFFFHETDTKRLWFADNEKGYIYPGRLEMCCFIPLNAFIVSKNEYGSIYFNSALTQLRKKESLVTVYSKVVDNNLVLECSIQ